LGEGGSLNTSRNVKNEKLGNWQLLCYKVEFIIFENITFINLYYYTL